jgi:ADP-heptose:LPS heptosyltransferase
VDVLIVKLGALGDVVNTLPLAVLLKERLGARIHWLVAPLSHPLLSSHECVDNAILFNAKSSLPSIASQLRVVREQRFDLILDLQRILKSGLISLVMRGGRTIGFDRGRCKELSWAFPFDRIPPADPSAHMIHQYLEFARFLGIEQFGVEWRIRPKGGLPEGLPSEYVVLNIGATKPANRWTVEGFAKLSLMVEKKLGIGCILTGGREDGEMARSIQDIAGKGLLNLVGRTRLDELVNVLDRARFVVTCDTGPMHLAVALGVRTFALFGPSDHRRTGPFRGRVIRAKIDCAPCRRKTCPDAQCMNSITAEQVFSAIGCGLRDPVG